MSQFDRTRIKDGWEKLCTNKQTLRKTNRHYENNGHLAVNNRHKKLNTGCAMSGLEIEQAYRQGCMALNESINKSKLTDKYDRRHILLVLQRLWGTAMAAVWIHSLLKMQDHGYITPNQVPTTTSKMPTWSKYWRLTNAIFQDQYFFLDHPWLFINSLTFSTPISNSLTSPGFSN